MRGGPADGVCLAELLTDVEERTVPESAGRSLVGCEQGLIRTLSLTHNISGLSLDLVRWSVLHSAYHITVLT